MSGNPPLSNPSEDADRIRMKRLAKLQNAASASNSAAPSPVPSTPSTSAASTPPPKPKPIPAPTPKRAPEPAFTPSPVPPKKKATAPLAKFKYDEWENDTITQVFQVTLDPEVALRTNNEVVWLKTFVEGEIMTEPGISLRLTADRLEGAVIARLDLDPRTFVPEDDYLPFLSQVPRDQTVFEYLVGCWKRLNTARSALLKKGFPPLDIQKALELEEKMRHLIISYVGIDLMSPEAFPYPEGKELGAQEFVAMLLSLSSFSAPLLSGPTSPTSLTASEIEPFLQDILRRFEPDDELEGVLGPVVSSLLSHESLFRREGIATVDSVWRGVVGGFEALVAHKAIAQMIVRMEQWNPPSATAPEFETKSLLGPLLRLNVFPRDWPYLAEAYFAHVEGRPAVDVESSRNSLRGTLKSLQSSLFQILNTIIRASAECREAVLAYFARVVSLNARRAGMQVEYETCSSDSFMTNIQLLLLRFAEPFMDANYTKIDRIDRHYFAHSSRIDVKEETRINATAPEAAQWAESNRAPAGTPPPNFISEIFYLTLAMNHYGYQKTIQTFEDYGKQIDDLRKHLDSINGDQSWVGTTFQRQVESAIKQAKDGIAKLEAMAAAAGTQLLDPETLFRSNGFNTFVTTWLIRFVDPAKTHPRPIVELPLPKEVPVDFKMLPEYILEDSIEYYIFVTRTAPRSLELSGRDELLIFALTFLTSTWYIKNPFLKLKIVEFLFFGTFRYRNEGPSLLGSVIETHPLALKHLMPAMMHYYIEVEQTGASSQFYDKFSAYRCRRNMGYIFKVVWSNPSHRQALRNETKNVDKFVRFVNMMINDVTYLMDESLSDLAQIYNIQLEMENQAEWERKPRQHRQEREQALRGLERQATGYTQLGKSTVELLKMFTAETKEPFMMPEIVDRLAAMLDYNLDALAGPRCQELKVKNKEKYSFNPRQLLSDVLQVYLNLSDQVNFVQAVARDGRSYKKELFEKAAGIARHHSLKSPQELEQLRLFVVKVEDAKATEEAEEELGEVPDEFLDPLMFTVMRDPVILPTSKAILDRSTIKSHLLSDSKDPFNRVPLTIEEVIPHTELRDRIRAFLAERKNKNTALDKPEEEVTHMNVD
ncbi:hypothetical protein DENSPDRAFT_835542 [Dentipellis sp. KUC8613]|nr:hypothetical protein DENSPDRAFT_835542 [Dentipellis sp. KUC8613]